MVVGYTMPLCLVSVPSLVAGKPLLLFSSASLIKPTASILCLSSCRGVLSLEEIPFSDSGEQTVILLPKALQITDNIAKAVLNDKLSTASVQELEVHLAQHA